MRERVIFPRKTQVRSGVILSVTPFSRQRTPQSCSSVVFKKRRTHVNTAYSNFACCVLKFHTKGNWGGGGGKVQRKCKSLHRSRCKMINAPISIPGEVMSSGNEWKKVLMIFQTWLLEPAHNHRKCCLNVTKPCSHQVTSGTGNTN